MHAAPFLAQWVIFSLCLAPSIHVPSAPYFEKCQVVDFSSIVRPSFLSLAWIDLISSNPGRRGRKGYY